MPAPLRNSLCGRHSKSATTQNLEDAMGWLFHNDKLRHQTPAQYIIEHFSHESETARTTVLAAAAVRSTIYAAIRNEDKTSGRSYVFCAVIPFRNSEKSGFGYKEQDESQGPVQCLCPDRIMQLLSPVEDIPRPGYTAKWRAQVAAIKAA